MLGGSGIEREGDWGVPIVDGVNQPSSSSGSDSEEPLDDFFWKERENTLTCLSAIVSPAFAMVPGPQLEGTGVIFHTRRLTGGAFRSPGTR